MQSLKCIAKTVPFAKKCPPLPKMTPPQENIVLHICKISEEKLLPNKYTHI